MCGKFIAVGGKSGRRGLGLVSLVALAMLAGPQAAPAQTSPVAAPSAQVVRGLENGLPLEVCDLLKKPLPQAINGLISLISRGRVRTTIAGSVFSRFGFQPWCRGYYGQLLSALRGVSERKPAYRSKFGPFVFGLRASYRASRYPGYNLVTVAWNEYAVSSRLRKYYLSYRINLGDWQVLRGGKTIYVDRRNRIQFAVRVDDENGISSPWVYSLKYNFQPRRVDRVAACAAPRTRWRASDHERARNSVTNSRPSPKISASSPTSAPRNGTRLSRHRMSIPTRNAGIRALLRISRPIANAVDA